MRKVTKVTTNPKMKQSNTQKLSNVINLNNPFIQSDPEIMKVLKELLMLLNKKKINKKKIQQQKQSKSLIGNTLGMKSNKIESSISSEPIDQPRYQPTPHINILGGNHDNNRYRQLEYEIKDLTKTINEQNRSNARPMIENKHELPINFTHVDDEAYDLVKKVAKYRDPEAAAKLVKHVPEFKNMMSDLAELGASSARVYLDEVNRDISILEKNKYELEEKNEKLNEEINELNDKVQSIETNRQQVEEKLNELQEQMTTKEQEYDNLNYSSEQIQRANDKLNLQIEKNKQQLEGLEITHKATQENLDKAIDKEMQLKEKLEILEEVLRQKEEEIKEVELLKKQAEEKADEEYTIRKKAERSKSKADVDRKKISKDVEQLKRDNRKSNLRLMTVEQLKKLVIDTSRITRKITKQELLDIIHEEEGLNDPILTPAKLVHSYSQSSQSSNV